jgi:hypothetical protein
MRTAYDFDMAFYIQNIRDSKIDKCQCQWVGHDTNNETVPKNLHCIEC